MNDQELLQAYSGNRSEEAFRTLIDRYVRLVYSACWRQLRDKHLAEDATQGVFVLLSQKAGGLRQERLAGWLLTVSRYACANIRRAQQRRQRHERAIAMQTAPESDQQNDEMSVLLDEALGRLAAADREAVVLRYFQEQSLKDVGEQLGVSEEAARKRVDRGVEKLRQFFIRRGVNVGTGATAAMLAQQTARAAMTGEMQLGITQGILETCRAGASSASAAATIAKGMKIMMFITKLKIAAVIFLLVLAAGAGGWFVNRTLAQNSAPEVPPVAGVAATSTQPAVTDLSLPLTSMHSMCAAIREGDRARAYACMAVDPNRPATEFDAFVLWNLANNRLAQACRDAYGAQGNRIRTLGGTIDEVASMFSGAQKNIVISGDTAILQSKVPQEVIDKVPANFRDAVVQWSDKPLRFKKDADGWKFDADHSMKVVMILNGEQGTPEELTQLHVQFMTDVAAMLDQLTQQVKNNDYPTVAETDQALKRGLAGEFRKHHVRGYRYLNLSPTDAPAPDLKTP